jgi:TolA-binding protein
LFGEVIGRYPEDAQVHVAVFNRAILAMREGRSADALRELTATLARSPQSPYIGRLRLARGILLVEAGRTFEAASEFGQAARHGEDAARIGLGRIAFDRRLWEEAAREFTAARDAGVGPEVRVAEYGLVAVLWNQGKRAEFKKAATALVQSGPDPATVAPLLLALATAEADDKRWSEARALALRLVGDHGGSDAAPAALAAVGGAALRDKQWALAREMYQTLADRYGTSAAARESQVDLAEALLRGGAPAEARRRLEAFVSSAPRDARVPSALLLLAEAREATGDRRGAAETYARLGKEYPGQLGEAGALSQARVLLAEKRWDEARPILERALDSADPAVASEAAYRLGEGFSAAGQHQDAVDAYMTAAYLAPDSPTGRRALLGAGQAFTALKQNAAAVIVYRKLTTAKGVEPELLESAKKELQALGAG